MPADVNDDGLVSISDILDIVGDLRTGGQRYLTVPTASGQGEGESNIKYVDVNGDNYLSVTDVLMVVNEIRAEGEAGAVPDTFNLSNPNDPFTITLGTSNNVLPVLLNDSGVAPLEVSRVGTSVAANNLGLTATTAKGGTVTIESGGANVLYTPPTLADNDSFFYGQDTFVYEVRDASDDTVSVTTVSIFANPAQGTTLASFTFKALAADGVTEITSVESGESFQLEVSVEDNRTTFSDSQFPDDPLGLFSAFFDLNFDQNAISLDPATNNPQGFAFDVVFGSDFIDENFTQAMFDVPGQINEAGSVQTDGLSLGTAPLGAGSFVLFTAGFTAATLAGGDADLLFDFTGDAAEGASADILFSRPSSLFAVPVAAVDFGALNFRVNAPLGAVADRFTTADPVNNPVNEDSTTTLDLLANDVRPPAQQNLPLLIDSVSGVSAGANVVTAADGLSVDYTPRADFTGFDTFTYTVINTAGFIDSAEVTVEVLPLNDPPVANDDFGPGFNNFIEGDGSRVLNVLANDFDVDNDQLTITNVSAPSGGGTAVIAIDGATITYTPGTSPGETFTYTISDGQLTDTATVTTVIAPFAEAADITVQTLDILGQPVSQVNLGDEFFVQVSVSDLRPAGATTLGLGVFSAFIDLLYSDTVSIVGTPELGPEYNSSFGSTGDLSVAGIINEIGSPQTVLVGGQPVGAGPEVLFTARFRADTFGQATFTSDPPEDLGNDIQLFDPPIILQPDDVAFGAATLTIVNPGAGTPVANPDAYTVAGGQTLTVDTRQTGVLDNDTDPGAPGTIVAQLVDDANLQGSLNLNADGTFTFTPNAGFFGPTSFQYLATDGGTPSAAATVTINVQVGVSDDTYATGMDQAVVASTRAAGVLGNDAVSQTATAALQSGPQSGALSFSTDGTFVYTPAAGFRGQVSFTYEVTDGAFTGTATANIFVGQAPLGDGIGGFVFADVNDDGVFQNGAGNERAIGGVEIILRQNGAEVDRTKTAADGSYSFPNAAPGVYQVVEVGPLNFSPGKNSVDASRSDEVTVTLGQNQPTQVNFGERGLMPWFINIVDELNSTTSNGVIVGANLNGVQRFFSLLDGWDGVQSVVVVLNASGTSATVSAVRNGVTSTRTVSTDGDPALRVMGRIDDEFVIRIEGGFSAFFGGPEGEYAANVDQLFAQLGG